jgi:hypothetical protein
MSGFGLAEVSGYTDGRIPWPTVDRRYTRGRLDNLHGFKGIDRATPYAAVANEISTRDVVVRNA